MLMNKVINKDGARIMGFMSPSLLAVLKKMEEMSIDGTFDITKWTLFAQVSFSFFILLNFSTVILHNFFN